jgi:hypothetical protein
MLASRRLEPIALQPSISLEGLVGSGSANFSSSNPAYSFSPTSNVGTGSKIIMHLSANSSDTISSITDSSGNTWTVDSHVSSLNDYISTTIASGNITTALSTSSTITINMSVSSSAAVSWRIYQWNFPSVAGVDTYGNSSIGDTTTGTANLNAITTNAQDLIIATINWQSGIGTLTPPFAFTEIAASIWYALPGRTGRFSSSFGWTNGSNASLCLVAYLP